MAVWEVFEQKFELTEKKSKCICSFFMSMVRDIYVVPSISFQTFFVQAFRIVVDSWKISMLLLHILWDDWPTFMVSRSNEQLQLQLEYTLLNPDCHSWWISKMQSGRQDTLEERYAIQFCSKLGKNAARETYGMLQTAFRPSYMNRASVFEWHKRFKEGRESVRNERCGGGVRKSTDQSWLAKGLGLGLLCWGFKGAQEEIPWKEVSTLQIGSFPAEQCTSPQLHPCHWLFEQDGHQDSSSSFLYSRPCSLWLLVILKAQRLSLWDNWGDRLWRRPLTRSHKRTSMGHFRSFWNGTTSALEPEEITSKETRVSCVYYQ